MTENADKKQKKHLFQPGQSGNPKGKAPGTRHKATMAMLTLLEGEGEALTRKAVEMALSGDNQALRLCLERLVSPAKDRTINIILPAVESAADLPKITAAILAAVAAGEIGASEAATLAKLIEIHGKAIETADIDARLKKLEEVNENGQ